jgi:hypothetical protein
MPFQMKQLFTEAPLPQAKQAKKRKQKIPAAIREAIWVKHMGKVYEGKCPTPWCPNTITVFDFHSGHDIPESKGGPTTVENLIPLCARCNTSMGNEYTFQQWAALSKMVPVQQQQQQPQPLQKPKTLFSRFLHCFTKPK